MNAIKPKIYPTLVIGLGGTGTQVVRHVKRRFRRVWGLDELEPLPSILQLLAVDTEPMQMQGSEEPLYYHEYAYLGKFDATRLIQNKERHPNYLDWWKWEEGEIPLGYIHSGAKQLRPVGRLSFVRNYVTFKQMLEMKLAEMGENEGVQKAQEQKFPVDTNLSVIYIVSSLSGGTGAGMFLDVAHVVKHYANRSLASRAIIVGIFVLPSAFEKDVRSDLQRRRIRANAYAALKELNYYHTKPSFQAYYPSEQALIPETPYRAFDRIFLIERTNAKGRSLSNNRAAAQMVAHYIHVASFSPISEEILRKDVNVTDEVKKGNNRFLAYSSFGVSGLVIPREGLWSYFLHRFAERTMQWIETTTEEEQERTLQVEIAFKDLRGAVSAIIRAQTKDPKVHPRLIQEFEAKQGVWLIVAHTFSETARNIVQRYGLEVLLEAVKRLETETLPKTFINPADRNPFEIPLPFATPLAPEIQPYPIWQLPFRSQQQRRIRQDAVRRGEIDSSNLRVWSACVTAWHDLLHDWTSSLAESMTNIREAAEMAMSRAESLVEQMQPYYRAGQTYDPNTATLYELETGMIGKEHLEVFWESILQNPEISERYQTSLFQAMIYSIIGEDGLIEPQNAQALLEVVEASVATMPEIKQQVINSFTIRNVLDYQNHEMGDGRFPPNHRVTQMFSRLGTHATVDGDTYPYSEADQEHNRFFGSAKRKDHEKNDSGGLEFLRATQSYQEFEWVETGDENRFDAVQIVHGLPVGLLDSIPDMYRQYNGDDFVRTTLHLERDWAEKFPEIYTPPTSFINSGNGIHANGSTNAKSNHSNPSQPSNETRPAYNTEEQDDYR